MFYSQKKSWQVNNLIYLHSLRTESLFLQVGIEILFIGYIFITAIIQFCVLSTSFTFLVAEYFFKVIMSQLYVGRGTNRANQDDTLNVGIQSWLGE